MFFLTNTQNDLGAGGSDTEYDPLDSWIIGLKVFSSPVPAILSDSTAESS